MNPITDNKPVNISENSSNSVQLLSSILPVILIAIPLMSVLVVVCHKYQVTFMRTLMRLAKIIFIYFFISLIIEKEKRISNNTKSA
jgi:hypothetical protein